MQLFHTLVPFSSQTLRPTIITIFSAVTTVASVSNAIAAEKKRVKDAKKAATANTSAPKVHVCVVCV